MGWLSYVSRDRSLWMIFKNSSALKCRSHYSTSNNEWTGEQVRSTFINYFRQQKHQFVRSSSVIPKKDEGTYFVNAGMNQFKPLFLGTVDPRSEMAKYQRVVNSQKCIRVGGKHNDLDDVGFDTYHHTFFEMLGSWSFADYFKREACVMAWDLLTQVYKLPKSQLYVTYFAGNDDLGLDADLECQEIWQEIGLPSDHILPFGMKDNFWAMGDTGPCGPCTEIHFDRTASPSHAKSLVNGGTPDVIELWNLVFMQFDRQPDGVLRKLPARHVDTGMGLERLVAVLQNKLSNYDTDLFCGLFGKIKETCNCPEYHGSLGNDPNSRIDTAYRIVADHARMFTVAIADGLVPGRRESEAKLRQIMYRCLHQAIHVLRAPVGLVGSLVPVVIDSLGQAYPELTINVERTVNIVNQTELRYLEVTSVGRKMLRKALNKYGSDVNRLTGEQLWEIQEGRFGKPVPADVISILASDLGISTDMEQFEKILQKHNKDSRAMADTAAADGVLHLTQHDVERLKHLNVPFTDDSFKYRIHKSTSNGYEFETLEAKVVALLSDNQFVDSVQDKEQVCGIIVDRTSFYAESGGQVADQGVMITQEGARATVRSVQTTQQYVLHSAVLQNGDISVGDVVTLSIDKTRRSECMLNHTATHLLQFALNEILGDVRQQGSMVSDSKFTFDFTCQKASVTNDDLSAAVTLANNIIKANAPVFCDAVPLDVARRLPGIVFLPDEVYPATVNVVSIGKSLQELISLHGGKSADNSHRICSVELCGGTHVSNTGHIGSLVVTNCQGSAQGTKRIIAVTGQLAFEALKNAQIFSTQMEEISASVISHDVTELQLRGQIEKKLSECRLLPKIERDRIQHEIEQLYRLSGISERENANKKLSLQQVLENFLDNCSNKQVSVIRLPFSKTRDMLDVLVRVSPKCALMLLSSDNKDSVLGIAYVPEGVSPGFTAVEWASCVSETLSGSHSAPRGKHARRADFSHVFSVPASDIRATLDRVSELANNFAAAAALKERKSHT